MPSYPFLNLANDGKVGVDEDISRKDGILLTSVLQWFNHDQSRVTTFSDIVNHKNGLSLRIIDWLITNFSRAFSVAIESDGLPRNLCKDYHKNLAAHNKKNFDPFARRRRIHIVLFGNERRVSTIGQLNFFRWFLSKDLVGFLLENKLVIEKHMKDSEAIQAGQGQRQGQRQGQGKSRVVRKSPPEKKPRTSDFPASKPGVKPKPCVLAEPQLYSGSFTMSF